MGTRAPVPCSVQVRRHSVGGLRRSSQLTQIEVLAGPDGDAFLADFLGQLSERRINLALLVRLGSKAQVSTALCVALADTEATLEAVEAVPGLADRVSRSTPVVALSMFPHGGRSALVGDLLSAMIIASVPVLAVASSVSVLTLTVPAAQVQQAVTAAKGILTLPSGAEIAIAPGVREEKSGTPARHSAETIASYWEPRIRTYGIEVRSALTAWSMDLPARSDPAAGDAVARGAVFTDAGSGVEDAAPFLVCTGLRRSEDVLRAQIVLPDQIEADRPLTLTAAGATSDPSRRRSVDAVWLQGPHFGDRFGVALRALDTLRRGNEEVIAASCTGSVVFLVMPGGRARSAASLLQDSFAEPEEVVPWRHRRGTP